VLAAGRQGRPAVVERDERPLVPVNLRSLRRGGVSVALAGGVGLLI